MKDEKKDGWPCNFDHAIINEITTDFQAVKTFYEKSRNLTACNDISSALFYLIRLFLFVLQKEKKIQGGAFRALAWRNRVTRVGLIFCDRHDIPCRALILFSTRYANKDANQIQFISVDSTGSVTNQFVRCSSKLQFRLSTWPNSVSTFLFFVFRPVDKFEISETKEKNRLGFVTFLLFFFSFCFL